MSIDSLLDNGVSARVEPQIFGRLSARSFRVARYRLATLTFLPRLRSGIIERSKMIAPLPVREFNDTHSSLFT